MSPSTRKTISFVCLVFTILWFVWIGLREAHYVRSVLRHQTGLHDILGTIYEEQIEGINFVMLVIFLIRGVFACFMYRRLRSEFCFNQAHFYGHRHASLIFAYDRVP